MGPVTSGRQLGGLRPPWAVLLLYMRGKPSEKRTRGLDQLPTPGHGRMRRTSPIPTEMPRCEM